MKNKLKHKNFWFLTVPVMALLLVFVSWSPVQDVDSEWPVGKKAMNGELDKNPQFKGGQDAMIKYLVSQIKYPEAAKKKNVTGKVFVQFLVTVKGVITKAKVVKSVDALLDAEALRVIKAMPDWEPGIKDGKPVAAEMTLPINFTL